MLQPQSSLTFNIVKALALLTHNAKARLCLSRNGRGHGKQGIQVPHTLQQVPLSSDARYDGPVRGMMTTVTDTEQAPVGYWVSADCLQLLPALKCSKAATHGL